MEAKGDMIVFKHLRQATSAIGQLAEVTALPRTKDSSFVQSNAAGSIRECKSHVEAGEMGATAAIWLKSLLAT